MNLFSRTFHGIYFDNTKKETRSIKFLKEMDKIILWGKFLKRVDKHYYNNESNLDRSRYKSKLILKIYFLQQ